MKPRSHLVGQLLTVLDLWFSPDLYREITIDLCPPQIRLVIWQHSWKKSCSTGPVPISTHTSNQCLLYNSKWGILHLRYLETFWQKKKTSFRIRSSTVLLHAKGSNFSCIKLQSIAYLSFKALSWLALILSTNTFVSTFLLSALLWLHALKLVPATFHTGYVLQ